MLNRIYRWLWQKMMNANETYDDGVVRLNTKLSGKGIASVPTNNLYFENGINFSIHQAQGGFLIQHYGKLSRPKNGSHHDPEQILTLVHNYEDLPAAINRVITMNTLNS